MRPANVKLVFFKEIMDTLRDRRTLFIMTILPILLYPVLMIATLMITQMQLSSIAAEETEVILIGAEHAPALVEELKKTADKDTEPEKEPEDTGNSFEKRSAPMNNNQAGRIDVLQNVRWREEAAYRDEFNQQVLDKKIGLVIEIPENFDAVLREGDEAAIADLSVHLYYFANNDKSSLVRDAIARRVEKYQKAILKDKLAGAAIPASLLDNRIADTDVGEEKALIKGQMGLFLSRFLAFMLVTMSLTGALYPAIDLSAGEKERGTMETLLISPAARIELVLGKFCTVFVISLVTALLNLASMGGTIAAIPAVLGPGVKDSLSLQTNVQIFVYMLMILVPLVALFSALSLAVSTFARSFKEGQNYLNPLMMAAFLPSMATMLPGFEMSNSVCFVPVLSAALLFRELFANNFEWTHVVLTFASTMIYSLLAVQWTVSLFDREEVLFRESEEINWTFWIKKGLRRATPTGFEALFVYALVMVLFFFGSTRMTPEHFLRGQLLLHYLVVFGVPVLFVRLFNVDFRSTLHLRGAGPVSLLRCLPFMVFALLTTRLILIWQVSTGGMPPSAPGSEQLEKIFSDLIGNHLWLAVFVIGITPAITEEVLCRGLLLSSFKRNLGAWRAVLVSSVLFGLLHMNPEQLLNATLLGIGLAAMVSRTGSLLPAMILHAVNNGGLVLLQAAQMKETVPDWMKPAMWLLSPGEAPEGGWPSTTVLAAAIAASFLLAAASYLLIPAVENKSK